jgi:2-oxoglutarate dehydrogenase E1 component
LYYDLLAARTKAQDTKTALVRVEQLYPAPIEEIKQELDRYPNASVVWAQDEPANQGPWPFVALNMVPELGRPVKLASRPALASTATGSHKRHEAENAKLVSQVFDQA